MNNNIVKLIFISSIVYRGFFLNILLTYIYNSLLFYKNTMKKILFGAAQPPRRPRTFQAISAARRCRDPRRFRDRDEFGPLGAFLRLERGRDRPSGHPDRAEGGKRGQRSGIGAITYRVGGAALLECSPQARRRRARALAGGTEERLRSDGLSVSDRGRGPCPRTAGTETETETGTGRTRTRTRVQA